MIANNTISAGVGFIPVVGDIILATFKANSRNAALLEEFLRLRGAEFLKNEAARVQADKNDLKPGAGRVKGEVVPGGHERGAVPEAGPSGSGTPATPALTPVKGGSWFRKGKST